MQVEGAFAYRAARGCIELNCLHLMVPAESCRWWDTAIAPTDIEADAVASAVEYLELRDLLVRHHARSAWVQVLESNEAAAHQNRLSRTLKKSPSPAIQRPG